MLSYVIDIKQHQKDFPGEEICGYLIEKSNGELIYVRCNNIAEDKKNSFEISIEDSQCAREIGNVKALVHSHPSKKHGSHMSPWDRISQLNYRDDWIILNNRGSLKTFPPLTPFKGRKYEHNINDCATIVRDFFDFNGIKFHIPDHSERWWHEGKNLYIDGYENAGFEKISKTSDIQYGDVFLINYASPVPNHALIYVGNNKILHHQMDNISKVERLDRFHLRFTHSIYRHKLISPEWCEKICNIIRGE